MIEIVKKLIGPVQPVGQHGIDASRLNNLKDMGDLVTELIITIDYIRVLNPNSHEHSVKKAVKEANRIITSIVDNYKQ